MKTRLVLLTALAILAAVSISQACGNRLEGYASALASGRANNPEQLEERLRSAGPEGLEAMAYVRGDLAEELAAAQRPGAPAGAVQEATERLARFDASMDSVGGARYCSRSQLYWYTDFEAAQAAARQQGKPILTLRLLGNLTDEFSCANSRFFSARISCCTGRAFARCQW